MTATTKTTGKFNRGRNNGTARCIDCGKLVQRANIANVTEANGRDGMCNSCFDKAGTQNMVADGIITCVEFQAIYGEHSDYCDCAPATGDTVVVAYPEGDADTGTVVSATPEAVTVKIGRKTVVSIPEAVAVISTPKGRHVLTAEERSRGGKAAIAAAKAKAAKAARKARRTSKAVAA